MVKQYRLIQMDLGLIFNCRSVFSPVSCVVWCFFGYRLLSIKSFTCFSGESGLNYFPLFLLQISGKEALEKTTLKSLGLIGGNAIVRLGEVKFGLSIFHFHSDGELILLQVPKKRQRKRKKKVTKKDTKLKHCGTQKLLHLPVYLRLLPRCALHSSRCWH